MPSKTKTVLKEKLTAKDLNNSDDVCQTATSFRLTNLQGTCTSKGCTYNEKITIAPKNATNTAVVNRFVGRANRC
jgi:hypothetical protein